MKDMNAKQTLLKGLSVFAVALLLPLGVVSGAALINLGPLSQVYETSLDAELDNTLETGVDVDVGTNVDARIEVTQKAAQTSSESVIDMNADSVFTVGDLRGFASTTVRQDPNLVGMSFGSDVVEVVYKERGELFALVPVTFNVTARAYANGEVELDYPWYNFLVVDNSSEIEANLEVAVSTALREENNAGNATTTSDVALSSSNVDNLSVGTDTQLESTFSAAEAAAVAQRIHTVLKTSFNTDASVNSS